MRQENFDFQVQVGQFYEGKEVGKVIVAKLKVAILHPAKWLTLMAEAFNSTYKPSAAIGPRY